MLISNNMYCHLYAYDTSSYIYAYIYAYISYIQSLNSYLQLHCSVTANDVLVFVSVVIMFTLYYMHVEILHFTYIHYMYVSTNQLL